MYSVRKMTLHNPKFSEGCSLDPFYELEAITEIIPNTFVFVLPPFSSYEPAENIIKNIDPFYLMYKWMNVWKDLKRTSHLFCVEVRNSSCYEIDDQDDCRDQFHHLPRYRPHINPFNILGLHGHDDLFHVQHDIIFVPFLLLAHVLRS